MNSAGRFWLSGDKGWYLRLADGRSGETLQHDFARHVYPWNNIYPWDAPVVEQGRGVFWAFGADGLLRLHVEEPRGGKPKIVIDKCYPRVIAQGSLEFLGLDRYNNLWMATFGKSGLYRIELPPPEGAEP